MTHKGVAAVGYDQRYQTTNYCKRAMAIWFI
jgi:hypothetical protein